MNEALQPSYDLRAAITKLICDYEMANTAFEVESITIRRYSIECGRGIADIQIKIVVT